MMRTKTSPKKVTKHRKVTQNNHAWHRFVSREIAIDYKTCLYFCCVMIFYCIYLAFLHIYSASILHMIEILFTAYIIGYLQVYVLHNFDEADHIGKWEVFSTIICSTLYAFTSYIFNWFDKHPMATLIFLGYMAFCYWCLYLANKIKRNLDTKLLNELLEDFKQTTSKESEL